MGDPKKKRKQYERPLRPWDKATIEREREIKKTFGLKNKRELWRLELILRKKRKNARKLLAFEAEARAKREQEIVKSLEKYGIVSSTASLDDILGLGIESMLERRLQTIVWRKGLANTVKQARQLIVHGHIAVKGKKVSKPGYLVTIGEENSLSYYGKPIVLETRQAEKEKLKEEFEKAKPEETNGAGQAGEIDETSSAEETLGETPEEKQAKGVVIE